MPVVARCLLLVVVATTFAGLFYRFVLRRAFVALEDRSLALLVERKFPQFGDSLVTCVELWESPSDGKSGATEGVWDPVIHTNMLEQAHERALRHLPDVDERAVFDFWPLRRAVTAAVIMLASVVCFAVASWPGFVLGVSRLYGLSDRPYPRQTVLEMEGFEDGVATVARGTNLTVRVRAEADRPVSPPDVCTIYYRTSEGERGRANMSKKGLPLEGYQHYVFDGKPFKAILNDITFDVVGNDQRIREQRVRVVESPQVTSVELNCRRPDYTRLDPADLEYYPGIKVPQGSSLTVQFRTNKPIREAEIALPGSDSLERLVPMDDGRIEMSFEIPELQDDFSREIVLHDEDGITSQKPYRLAIVSVPDFAPKVEVRMRGIGSAITPDARIPMAGEIRDDYAVDRSWFELQISNDETREFGFENASGDVEFSLDLREERSRDDNPLELDVESSVVLSVKSADEYDLGEAPNIGQSGRYELEVVSANQLVALLEARELGLRRRFEQIILELRETRDSLLRIQIDETDESGEESESGGESTTDPASISRRRQEVRMLRVQRAEQHSQRSAQEVLGVALSFEDIALELVNNRVDANDRVEGIERDIAGPLRSTVGISYPELDRRLNELRVSLERLENDEIDVSLRSVLDQADVIILELESVLEKMLELETYNELVDLIRSMIKDQEELTERTKDQRKKSALDLLK